MLLGPTMFIVTLGHRGLFPAIGALVLGSGMLLLGPAVSATAAGVIFNSNGFESLPYSLTSLPGQQGWVAAGGGVSTATVQNTVVASGSQAVTVTRAPTLIGDQRWFVPQTGFPTQKFVAVDWDMRVEGPAGNVNLGQFGPFFGVDTYDADSGVSVLGTLGVDATTGDVLYQAQTSGALTETGATANFGQWNHFRIVMDFSTDTYRGYFNGALVANSGFVDIGAGLDNFTDADMATFAAAPDPSSGALPGTAMFDNFVIRDGLLGDYDLDGDVDNFDYTTWKAAFGTNVAVPGNNADGNKNGVVDAADYVIWRNNFGMSLFSGTSTGSASASAAVPEPSSALLAIFGLPTMIGRPFWRRRRLC